ncbi:MAG: hypothetical protein BroJett015_43720 [Chloroflexota bacterium]|nr:MAG: hypothetical protein BroJett015_43720 [Chloroflexota bacterium]
MGRGVTVDVAVGRGVNVGRDVGVAVSTMVGNDCCVWAGLSDRTVTVEVIVLTGVTEATGMLIGVMEALTVDKLEVVQLVTKNIATIVIPTYICDFISFPSLSADCKVYPKGHIV